MIVILYRDYNLEEVIEVGVSSRADLDALIADWSREHPEPEFVYYDTTNKWGEQPKYRASRAELVAWKLSLRDFLARSGRVKEWTEISLDADAPLT